MTEREENWRAVQGWEVYEISDKGRLRRCLPEGGYRMLNPSFKEHYYCCQLCMNGLQRYVRVHTLVAEAFLGGVPKDYEVNHKDGDKLNNWVENLEVVTHAQNQRHASETGLMSMGERHYLSKLTEDDVRQIRKECEETKHLWGWQRRLAKKWGLHQVTVSCIYLRKTWKHI